MIKISDSESAEISVQLGEPVALTTPAYEIGMDDVLVVVHPQTGVGPLALDQVRSIFSGEVTNWHEVGGADLPVEVWTYATGEDIQRYFDGLVLQGRPIASTARLAVSAQNMSDSVGVDPGAVGFLPEHWKTGNTREALNLGSLPVLAIVNREPQGAVRSLLACLQTLGTPSP